MSNFEFGCGPHLQNRTMQTKNLKTETSMTSQIERYLLLQGKHHTKQQWAPQFCTDGQPLVVQNHQQHLT